METQTEETKVQETEEKVEVQETQEDTVLAPETPGAEAEIAAKALEANPETVPLGVAKGLREDRRELRDAMKAKDQLIEHLQSQLAAQKPAVQQVVVSPAEKYIAEHKDEFDPDIEALPASVQIAQDRWNKEQLAAQSQAEQARIQSERTNESLARAQSTISDYEDIVELGNQYLDAGDRLMIKQSKDPALELYNRCIDKTLKAGTKDSTILRSHLKTKLAPQSAKPKPKVEEPQTATAEAEEPMSPQLAHARRLLGL